MDRFIAANREELSKCFPDGAEVFFVLGTNPGKIPLRAIAVGDCASRFRGEAALFIPGCPPIEQEVREVILRGRKKFERMEDPRGKGAALFGPG